MAKKKWTGTPIPPEQPVRAQPAKSKYKPILVECDCFMCSGTAWKVSDPIRNHMENDLKKRVLLNSTEVEIKTGDIASPVLDKDRTDKARKVCASLSDDSKFAEVWFTSNLYEGGERIFSEPFWLEYNESSGEEKVKIKADSYACYLPLDVLKLVKEGDLLYWTVEATDSKQQKRKIVLMARANQLDYRYKYFGSFQDAVKVVEEPVWV